MDGDAEAIVGCMTELSREPHGPERSTRLRRNVVSAGRMPSDRQQSAISKPQQNDRVIRVKQEGSFSRRCSRKTQHQGSALLVRDEAAELPPGLVQGLQVLLAHGRVRLPHLRSLDPPSSTPKHRIQNWTSAAEIIPVGAYAREDELFPRT